MGKFNFEFKGVKSGDGFNETRHLKRIVDLAEIPTLLAAFSADDGIELLTLRKLPEAKPKPVVAQKVVSK